MFRKTGKMKKYLIIIVITFSLFNNSCQKGIASEEIASDYNGIITGSDARKCVCCGGLMINFDGETQPYTGDFKLIDNAADLGISESDKFPIYAKVQWKPDTTNVCNHIIITKFERR
jgi:hypothetical protein